MALNFGQLLAAPTSGRTGGVKAGANITIASDGTISASGGGGGLTGLSEIDDISAGFNGVTTTFLLQSAGSNLPSSTGVGQLILVIGGAVQNPGTAFTFNSATSQVTFTSAPLTGRTFIGWVGGSPAAGPGTITAVTAGTGLSGGGISGAVTLSAAFATAGQAAAGTSTTTVSSPAYSVPKDAANMTGAAILPNGTTVQQPATPAKGMFRLNTTASAPYTTATSAGIPEFYDGTKWVPSPPLPTPLPSGSSSKFLSYNSVANNFQWQGADNYIRVGIDIGSIADVQQGYPSGNDAGSVCAITPQVSGVSFGLFCCHGTFQPGQLDSQFRLAISVYDASAGVFVSVDYVQPQCNDIGGQLLYVPFSVQTTLTLDPARTYSCYLWGAKASATGTATPMQGSVRFIAFN